MPTGAATCLSQFLVVKVADGAARSSLRNITSAVCGAEDLGLLPPTMHPWPLCTGDYQKVGNPQGRNRISAPRLWGTIVTQPWK